MAKKWWLDEKYHVNASSRDCIRIDKNNVLHLRYSIYRDNEEPIDRRAVGRELKKIIGCEKFLTVVDNRKLRGDERWINEIQFFCKKENLNNDQVELIQSYLKNLYI